MIRIPHPYRDFQKNLFLGEGMVLFMSSEPEGGASDDDEPIAASGGSAGGTGGSGTPPTPPTPPETPEEPIFEAPKEGAQTAQAKPKFEPKKKALTKKDLDEEFENQQAIKSAKDKKEKQAVISNIYEKGAEKGLFRNLKDVVKDTPELAAQGEFETHWISRLGDYNGIQNQIDGLVEKRKTLSDTKFIKDSPNFQAEFRKTYQELLGIQRQGGLPLSPETKKLLNQQAQEKAANNVQVDGEDNELKDPTDPNGRRLVLKRKDVLKAIDGVIAALLEKRRQEFLELMDYMLDNLKRRLTFLIEKWQVDPPEGYEDVQEAWIEYCVELLETLDKTDFTTLDLSKPDFPEMDKHFSLAKDWWYSISLFEDTYADFQRAKEEDISRETLQAQFNDLEKNAKENLTDKKVHDYQEKLDAITKEIDTLLPELEALKEHAHDQGERELRESEIITLKNAKKTLLEKRDVKKLVQDTLDSEEVLADKTFSRSGVTLQVKKGLKQQLEFFDKAPLDTQERRTLMRAMNDGMKEMKQAFDNIQIEGNVQFVETLNKLRLYKKSIRAKEGPVTQEVIWINPFEAWGHVWHSVTTTIKGNIETEAKRGAGYFQKQGTKWMQYIPNPTNSQVIKSLTELSANGEQEAEHAEHGRVGDIQKGYEGFNTEHLYHLAADTKDRWEFKACLNLLADRGRLNWYDPWIYKQLNQWQKTVQLPEDPNWHQTYITASDDMLRQAFFYIYRVTDDYRNLKNKNTGSWESKKGEFKKGCGLLAAEPGGLKREADKLLEQFKATAEHNAHTGQHHPSKADPIKYEAIIEYAIEQGKMQGEDRMYYINQGIASGFLPFDRGAELTKFNNTYPPVDRYDSGSPRGDRPTIYDIKEWACHDKVTNIYDVFETLSDNTAANQRVSKTISQGQNRVDHDDAPMLAGHIDAETINRLLSANGQGGYGLPATGLQSLVVGHELWMDMYAHRYSEKKKEFNDSQLNRFVTMFMRFDGITSRQMYANTTTYWRLDESVADNSEPRAKGSYESLFGHETARKNQGKGNTISSYLKSVKGYLEILDFDQDFALIRKLNNKELRSKDAIDSFVRGFKNKHGDEAAKRIFGEPPMDNIDKIYESAIPSYIKFITEKHSDRVTAMVSAINNDHKKIWAAQEAAGETSLIQRLKEVEKKKAAVRSEAYAVAQGQDPHGHGHGGHGHGGHGHGGHGEHGDDHGHEEGGHGAAAHHRQGAYDDEDMQEAAERRNGKWSFSRRDHQSNRKTY